MGVAMSLFLVAVGAVLAFAVTWTTNGVDLHVVGWILIAVGLFGLVLSIAFWESLMRPPLPPRRRGPPDEMPTRRF